MAATVRAITRLTTRTPTLRPRSREIHMDASPPANHVHRDISEIFNETFSEAGPHPSVERINRFMNTVYVHQPRAVTLFNINYRTQTERSTIKGLRVGSHVRRTGPQKSLVLVSGLPMQDPSAIGVNLYVAAMLSRLKPMYPCDVSFIPLAHPREYEQRWRKTVSRDTLLRGDAGGMPSLSLAPAPVPSVASHEDCIVPENISLELRDTCRPIEAYVTRQNKYYVNIEVDMNAQRSTMQYKNNSLPNLASRGKHRRFFANPPPLDPASTPSILADPIRIHGADSLLSPMIESPSLVLELRSSKALGDEQIVARGEEVIAMLKELIE